MTSQNPAPLRPTETILSEIEAIVCQVNPIELLSHLAVINLMHSEDEHPEVEEISRWQVRIEFLTWVILKGNFPFPDPEPFIDASILDPVESLLDEYFASFASNLIATARAAGIPGAEASLQVQLQLEALYVRGEGLPTQVEQLATEIYGPHDSWMESHLGFTIRDAFICANGAAKLVASKLSEKKKEAQETAQEVAEYYGGLLRKSPDELNEEERGAAQMLREKGISGDDFGSQSGTQMLFTRLRETVGFTEEELCQAVGARVDPDRVDAFLSRMSQAPGEVSSDPDPIGFNPLTQFPLLKDGDRYLIPVLPALYEALLSSFHFEIWGDPAYKNIYDKARSDWLEQEALGAFSRLIPAAVSKWSLKYGPKKARIELDGLVLYDDKLVLIECKWKALTLSARMGNVADARTDISKSIAAAYSQAARARDYIRAANGPITFTAEDGSEVIVDPAAVKEIYLVSLMGKGGLSIVAANPANLVPLGLLQQGDYPWALSTTDLTVVCSLMEFPSQLFDYLKKRNAVMLDGRFVFHDEWDILGAYFVGALNTKDPEYEGANRIMLTGMDESIDRFLRSQEDQNLPRVERPRRKLPENIRRIILEIENSGLPDRSNVAIALLSFSDENLKQLEEAATATRLRAISDHAIHSAAVYDPIGDVGITVVAGFEDNDAIRRHLKMVCLTRKYKQRATTWIGIGMDAGTPAVSCMAFYVNESWAEDDAMEEFLRS